MRQPVPKIVRRAWALFMVSASLAACGGSGSSTPDGGRPDSGRVRRDAGAEEADAGGLDGAVDPSQHVATHGSALAVTRDGLFALAINRRTGRTQGSTVERFEIDISSGEMSPAGAVNAPEASQVIIGPDDNTAFVANAIEVVRYAQIKQGERLSVSRAYRFAPGGNEARGLALSPNGNFLFVANWSNGTVIMLNALDMAEVATIDLNQALAESGVLGGVSGRGGLAHPYAIAVTNDGDSSDEDERVFITEYFSQAKLSNIPSDDTQFELGRQGIVYQFDISTQTLGPLIYLAPRASTFADSLGGETYCFPNLLNIAAYSLGRIYISGTCASPRGPIGPRLDSRTGEVADASNFKTLMHAAIFVVDTEALAEIPDEGVLLSEAAQAAFDADSTPDDQNRRIPHLLSTIQFVPGTRTAWASAYGSDAVFRLEWGNDGKFVQLGVPFGRYIDLANTDRGAGHLPYGLYLTSDARTAVTVNEHTRNISFIDLQERRVIGAAEMSVPNPTLQEKAVNDGRRNFVTGTGRWSYRGQSWSSCEGCHPNGLTDNVTWFFPRGPRQSISLDGSFSSRVEGVQRLFGWTGHLDEVHDFESLVRDVSGGVGAIVHQDSSPPVPADRIHFNGYQPVPAGTARTATVHSGLNSSTKDLMPEGTGDVRSVRADWDDVEKYLAKIKSPRGPTNLDQQQIIAGQLVYTTGFCSACHSTDMWTMSRRFYVPGEDNNNIATGRLHNDTYDAPPGYRVPVNPPTNNMDRESTYRHLDPLDDQINCALRAVGTITPTAATGNQGIGADGVSVLEVRSDMQSFAQGRSGYNIPSLLGIAHGAPYFHAGNARTLEELLTTVFAGHHAAYGGNFVPTDATKKAQLIQFLLSIDEDSGMPQPPMMLGFSPNLCPESL